MWLYVSRGKYGDMGGEENYSKKKYAKIGLWWGGGGRGRLGLSLVSRLFDAGADEIFKFRAVGRRIRRRKRRRRMRRRKRRRSSMSYVGKFEVTSPQSTQRVA